MSDNPNTKTVTAGTVDKYSTTTFSRNAMSPEQFAGIMARRAAMLEKEKNWAKEVAEGKEFIRLMNEVCPCEVVEEDVPNVLQQLATDGDEDEEGDDNNDWDVDSDVSEMDAAELYGTKTEDTAAKDEGQGAKDKETEGLDAGVNDLEKKTEALKVAEPTWGFGDV